MKRLESEEATMSDTQFESKTPDVFGDRIKAWLLLAIGLGLIWALAFAALPLGRCLPAVGPVMDAIDRADIDAGAYWYTQSEETARAQMFIKNAIRRHE
jgi:hypothetical protein